MNILLCSTLTDQRGIFVNHLKQVSEIVLRDYTGWVINATQITDQRVREEIRRLQDRGVYLAEVDQSLIPDKIENDHLNLLAKTAEVARNLGVRKIQYTDGDRIMVAAKYFPDDFHEMAKTASETVGEMGSFLNLRRSPEDYFTHHPPLVQTELEFNRLYSKAFGLPLDIASTAQVMSLDVLVEIVQRSPQIESVTFPHPKWLIIAKEMGAKIASVETHNVLTFETPEQFKKVHTEQDYGLTQQIYMATLGRDSTLSPREWRFRFETERQYLTLLRNHLGRLGLDDQTKENLTYEIEGSLQHLEGRQKAILEALEHSGRRPEQNDI